MTTQPYIDEPTETDQVDAALALYGGDARATIAAALDMLQFVRGQLVLTEAAMSQGFTRGFKPVYEPESRLDPTRI